MSPPQSRMSAELLNAVEQLNRISDALASRNPALVNDPSFLSSITEAAEAIERYEPMPEFPHIAAHAPQTLRLHPDERGFTPRIEDLFIDASSLGGTVTFSARYLGTAAVHGGAISLLFDDAIGRLANASDSRPLARTAYLKVDFRRLVPIDTPLDFAAFVSKEEGRKRYLGATLSLHGTALAEAEGLWIQPHHPSGEPQ